MEKFNSIYLVIPILTVLMFDLGLTLHFSDFVRIVRRPRAMVIGLFGQLVVLPLIALGIISALSVPPVFAIGIMLIACCPGGSSSNVFSKLADGDVALSVSLTAVSSVVTLFTLPVIMTLVTSRLGETVGIVLPVGNLLKQNCLTMLLPIVAGIVIRKFFNNPAIATPAIVYALIMNIVLLAYVGVVSLVKNHTATGAGILG